MKQVPEWSWKCKLHLQYKRQNSPWVLSWSTDWWIAAIHPLHHHVLEGSAVSNRKRCRNTSVPMRLSGHGIAPAYLEVDYAGKHSNIPSSKNLPFTKFFWESAFLSFHTSFHLPKHLSCIFIESLHPMIPSHPNSQLSSPHPSTKKRFRIAYGGEKGKQPPRSLKTVRPWKVTWPQ